MSFSRQWEGRTWSSGVMEYWSNGKAKNTKIIRIEAFFNTPTLQHSNTPTLHEV
jgi:hypothetical protein